MKSYNTSYCLNLQEKKIKIFLFRKRSKIKHSSDMVYFYSESEMKKEHFITVNSNDKWYNKVRKCVVGSKTSTFAQDIKNCSAVLAINKFVDCSKITMN